MAKPSSKEFGKIGVVEYRRRFAGFVRPLPLRRPPLDTRQPHLPLVASEQSVSEGNAKAKGSPPLRQHWRRCLQEMFVTIHRKGWNAYAFGGTARGLLHRGPSFVPRDVDLVFAEEHFSAFQHHFQALVRDINRFGGLRMRAGHVDIDAWPITRTWAFNRNTSLVPSFENLPKTTFLNIDALAVELFPKAGVARRIFDGGCLEAHSKKLLDINFYDNPLPDLCVVRSLYYAYKFDLGISARLSEYIQHESSNFSLQHLVAVQVQHYGQIQFDVEMLGRILSKLRLNRPLGSTQLFGLRYRQRKLI